MFYGLESIDVRVLESKNDNPGSTTGPLQLDTKTVTVKYRLDFDNRDYVSFTLYNIYGNILRLPNIILNFCNSFHRLSFFKMAKRVNLQAHESQLNLEKVDSVVLLELFPFALILDHDMKIKGAGEKVFESW